MNATRLLPLLLLALLAGLLTACQTSDSDLLATQGFGHFNAKSIDTSLDDSSPPPQPGALRTQSSHLLPGVSAEGIVRGLGSDAYVVSITAFGVPLSTCTNQGGNQAPGQNPAFAATGDDNVGGDPSNRNGRYEFDATTYGIDPASIPTEGTCPNSNWSADVYWIDWNEIVLELQFVEDDGNLSPVETLTYTCETLQPSAQEPEGSISCSLNP